MDKKYIFIGTFFIIALFSILAYSNFGNNSPSLNLTPSQNECYDCGEDGWELMDVKCDSKISSKEDAIMCLSKFEWSSVNPNTSPSKIQEGYIKLHDYGLTNDKKNSIKVYNYNQWSIDEEGNMYLEGQLG